jgi:hypothetical protein
MKKETTKKVILILTLGVVAYVIYTIWQAFKNGERTLAGLLAAPFTGLSAAWSAVTGLFSSVTGGAGGGNGTAAQNASALNAATGVADNSQMGQFTTASANALVANPSADTSPQVADANLNMLASQLNQPDPTLGTFNSYLTTNTTDSAGSLLQPVN